MNSSEGGPHYRQYVETEKRIRELQEQTSQQQRINEFLVHRHQDLRPLLDRQAKLEVELDIAWRSLRTAQERAQTAARSAAEAVERARARAEAEARAIAAEQRLAALKNPGQSFVPSPGPEARSPLSRPMSPAGGSDLETAERTYEDTKRELEAVRDTIALRTAELRTKFGLPPETS